jgi:hypothetical protein
MTKIDLTRPVQIPDWLEIARRPVDHARCGARCIQR